MFLEGDVEMRNEKCLDTGDDAVGTNSASGSVASAPALSSPRNNRVVWVELMRLLACLIVIARHVFPENPDLTNNSQYVFVWSLLSDGVAFFWFITGFFMYSKSYSYKKTLKKLLTGVVIPMLIFNIISIALDNLTNGRALFSADNIGDEFFALITFSQPVGCYHLWFLNLYILLALISPAVNLFANYLDENKTRQNIFLAISAALLFINDITQNSTLDFTFEGVGGLAPAILLTLCGHIIYRRIEDVSTRKTLRTSVVRPSTSQVTTSTCIIALIGLFVINLARTAMQLALSSVSADYEDHILFWYALPSFLCAACITLVVARIRIAPTGKFAALIRLLASYALYVY